MQDLRKSPALNRLQFAPMETKHDNKYMTLDCQVDEWGCMADAQNLVQMVAIAMGARVNRWHQELYTPPPLSKSPRKGGNRYPQSH